jgi:hypothetical protein
MIIIIIMDIKKCNIKNFIKINIKFNKKGIYNLFFREKKSKCFQV